MNKTCTQQTLTDTRSTNFTDSICRTGISLTPKVGTKGKTVRTNGVNDGHARLALGKIIGTGDGVGVGMGR